MSQHQQHDDKRPWRVIIIHGYKSFPADCWFPWLQGVLQQAHSQVRIPLLPLPTAPSIERWVPAVLDELHGDLSHTILLGHSVGCQAILRAIERLPANTVLAGLILVAGWLVLDPAQLQKPGRGERTKSWIETPLDWTAIVPKSTHWATVFSSNDRLIPVENHHLFAKHLHIQPLVLENRGHFSVNDGCTEIPELLNILRSWNIPLAPVPSTKHL